MFSVIVQRSTKMKEQLSKIVQCKSTIKLADDKTLNWYTGMMSWCGYSHKIKMNYIFWWYLVCYLFCIFQLNILTTKTSVSWIYSPISYLRHQKVKGSASISTLNLKIFQSFKAAAKSKKVHIIFCFCQNKKSISLQLSEWRNFETIQVFADMDIAFHILHPNWSSQTFSFPVLNKVTFTENHWLRNI